MLNFYGVVVDASAGIGFKISSFMTTPIWAIGRAVAIMVGQNIGVKKINQAKKVVIAGLKVNLITTTLVVLIFQIFAKQIVALFDTNIEVVANGNNLYTYSLLIWFDFICYYVYI